MNLINLRKSLILSKKQTLISAHCFTGDIAFNESLPIWYTEKGENKNCLFLSVVNWFRTQPDHPPYHTLQLWGSGKSHSKFKKKNLHFWKIRRMDLRKSRIICKEQTLLSAHSRAPNISFIIWYIVERRKEELPLFKCGQLISNSARSPTISHTAALWFWKSTSKIEKSFIAFLKNTHSIILDAKVFWVCKFLF